MLTQVYEGVTMSKKVLLPQLIPNPRDKQIITQLSLRKNLKVGTASEPNYRDCLFEQDQDLLFRSDSKDSLVSERERDPTLKQTISIDPSEYENFNKIDFQRKKMPNHTPAVYKQKLHVHSQKVLEQYNSVGVSDRQSTTLRDPTSKLKTPAEYGATETEQTQCSEQAPPAQMSKSNLNMTKKGSNQYVQGQLSDLRSMNSLTRL